MYKQRFSLVSVYDKSKLEKICNLFKKNNIEIISTGSTAKHIKNIGKLKGNFLWEFKSL